MLCQGSEIFINGEAVQVDPVIYSILRSLADSRQLLHKNVPDDASNLLYQWYLNGYIVPVAD